MQLGSSLYQAYYMHTLALSEAASTAHVLKWFNKVPTITSSIQGRYGYWLCYHCFPREETFLRKLLVMCLWVDECECYEPAKEACLIKTSAYPDRLADSCKRSSVNRMAAGSRLSWCNMDFFSCLQLFKHTALTYHLSRL